MSAAVLMLQGTMSDAGKSILTAALCRLLSRQGIRVAPFKPQNMALNSAVTVDGGEIGRAQAMQAAACGLSPHTDMNPILLKPNSDRSSQVIVQGRAVGNMDARHYHDFKLQLRGPLMESFHRLTAAYQVVIVEGAGSPAEINLRERDIANMGFAELADCPVVLIGDIDRGGVFAQMIGTLHLLTPPERQRVKGLIINKFRGDLSLLAPGLTWLEKESGKPVLGVMPYLAGLSLEAEDSFFDRRAGHKETAEMFRVVVPRLPRLSNHTDLDPLMLHGGVDVRIIQGGETIPAADLIVLPGSKNVRQDMQWLEEQGWRQAILRHVRYGGRVVGICGGFQMLGRLIRDPHGQEGPPGECTGFGLLDMETVITPVKQLSNNQGTLSWGGTLVAGYEIHMGISQGAALEHPAMILQEGPHGALSGDGQIMGCYLHGVFDLPQACQALLTWAGMGENTPPDIGASRNASLERLADAFAAHMDSSQLAALLPGVAIHHCRQALPAL